MPPLDNTKSQHFDKSAAVVKYLVDQTRGMPDRIHILSLILSKKEGWIPLY